jgi:H2-forming N5,N10-methylenetetrahydromethanopterin dehydrogenase-like enzyme
LTFTEPPAPNDVIDARILTTTATVASIASGNGLNQFIADDAGAQIFTGTSATTLRVEVNPVGDIDIKTGSKLTYEQSAINIAANATPYVIATFAQATYTSAKYQIQVKKDSTNFQAMEALVLTDKAGNAYVTTYGVINNGTEMGTLSANVLSGNVNLWFTSVTNMTNANVKAFGTYII